MKKPNRWVGFGNKDLEKPHVAASRVSAWVLSRKDGRSTWCSGRRGVVRIGVESSCPNMSPEVAPDGNAQSAGRCSREMISSASRL